jgi:hypothetical protein
LPWQVLAKAPAIGAPFQNTVPLMNALRGNHVDIIARPVAEISPGPAGRTERARPCRCFDTAESFDRGGRMIQAAGTTGERNF